MSAQADPKLLKAETDVHHKAIGSISDPYGMASTADWDGVNSHWTVRLSQCQNRWSWIVQLGVINH